MAMAEEAMVPATAEVAALRLAAEVAAAATAKGRRNEIKLARAKRRRVSEAEGKRRRAQPDAVGVDLLEREAGRPSHHVGR